METVIDTKAAFEEFLEDVGFEEDLSACSSLNCYEQLYKRTLVKYAAKLVAQKIIEDLAQRASDSCKLIRSYYNKELHWDRKRW